MECTSHRKELKIFRFERRKDLMTEYVIGSLEDLFGFTSRVESRVFLVDAFLSKYDLEVCISDDVFTLAPAYFESHADHDERFSPVTIIGMEPMGVWNAFLIGWKPWKVSIEVCFMYPSSSFGPDTVWVFRRRKNN